MKKLLMLVCIALIATNVFAQSKLNGAGASFPYAVYSAWAFYYQQAAKVQINYQPIGSGGGVKQIIAKTVDFGATDDPMNIEDLKKNNLIQFPAVIGGVVLVVNVDGVKTNQLVLNAETVSAIFMGKITKWNDPAIQATNKGLKLPDTKITVVHRSDSSGTTAVFTNYLSGASVEWKNTMGAGKSMNWPTGIAGKGNEGVAGYIKQIKNSIGYVEFSYANANKIPYTKLVNTDGKIVSPSSPAFIAAAANAKWDSSNGYNLWMVNSTGADSWPIATATFILLNKANSKETNQNVMKFFEWSFKNGDKTAEALLFVPLPASLKADIIEYVNKNL